MQAIRKLVFLGAILFAFPACARADIFTSSLDLGTVTPPQTLHDNSVSLVFDSNGNPITNPNHVLGAGDIISGVLRINNTANGSQINSPTQLSILFSAQISGPVQAPFGTTAGAPLLYNLTAVTSGPLSINSLLGGTGSAYATANANTNNFAGTSFASSSVFAVLESPNAATNDTQGYSANINDLRTKYKLDLTGGLVAATDFFQARLTSQGGPLTLGQLASLPANTFIGNDSGLFSVLLNPDGLGFGLVSANTQGYNNSGAPQTFTGQLAFDASLTTPNSNEAALGYSFSDDTRVKLAAVAVPEPASMALVLIGVGCVGGAITRRRK